MKDSELLQINHVWNRSRDVISKHKTPFDVSQFDELVAAIFCPGPYCFFVIDFFDLSIVYESPSVKQLLAIEGDVSLQKILATIHPEDREFIAKAEEAILNFLYKNIGREKVLKYKMNRCFRSQNPEGEYRLFLHQALILTVDENGSFGKCLNIMTDISHITNINNYKVSFIGIGGEPSYLNIDPQYNHGKKAIDNLSNREIEILKLIKEGLTAKEIADRLNISLHTVTTHRKNILQKSNAKSMVQLISRCVEEGML